MHLGRLEEEEETALIEPALHFVPQVKNLQVITRFLLSFSPHHQAKAPRLEPWAKLMLKCGGLFALQKSKGEICIISNDSLHCNNAQRRIRIATSWFFISSLSTVWQQRKTAYCSSKCLNIQQARRRDRQVWTRFSIGLSLSWLSVCT